jgi:hypothetical protein
MIKEVESLIASVKGISDTSTEGVLASLAIDIEDCAKDISTMGFGSKGLSL